MVAVEYDERMIPLLKDSSPTCEVIHGDALKVDLGEILAGLPEPRVLVSNMPYYITGPLLDRFAQVRSHYKCAVLMMQKEVGQKILAKPKERERGALSVCLQAEFEISLVCKVPPGSFMPPPKVDSLVLKLVPRVSAVSELFRKTVRAGFGQPRKTLINNFGATFRRPREEIAELVLAAGFPETARAFELTEADWEVLTTHTIAANWLT
jgi:16S rRNA (adenine1518-N6/adenine1519-N6)-dimethyltransferase